MPDHKFEFYLEREPDQSAILTSLSFREPDQIEWIRVQEKQVVQDQVSNYNITTRHFQAPRYEVEFRMRLATAAGIAKARTLSETLRRGHQFSFAYDVDKMFASTLVSDADWGATTLSIVDWGLLDVGEYYRLTAFSGFILPSNPAWETWEQAWPGFVHTHLFRVLDADIVSTIFPELITNFPAGSAVMSQEYYTSCLLIDDVFEETYASNQWDWMWSARMVEQSPPILSYPAW